MVIRIQHHNRRGALEVATELSANRLVEGGGPAKCHLMTVGATCAIGNPHCCSLPLALNRLWDDRLS